MIGTAKGGGLISRAVREALGTLVSPQVCEQLITRSLRTQGLTSIPEAGSQIGEWLEAGLRPEVETVVGSDAADLVMMQLGPIAAYAAIAIVKPTTPQVNQTLSGARGTSSGPPFTLRSPYYSDEPERPTNLRINPEETDWRRLDSHRPDNDIAFHTARPPAMDVEQATKPTPVPMPSVFAATSDMGNLEALRRYLGATATVAHIPDLVSLLEALNAPGLVDPIVLIDCQRPTVHTTSVAALGQDLPQGTTVVLWGADEGTWSQVEHDLAPGCRWVRCSREATTADVGSLCAMLLG